MKHIQSQKNSTNLRRVIFLFAVIGLLIGGGFWWWQSSGVTTFDDQTEVDSNRRSAAQNSQPIVLNDNLPIANRHLESIGDKLAEALFHLRERHHDPARQALTEASQIAVKTEDNPQLRDTLTNGIKQVENNIANGKIEEAEETISLLLDQLNMTGN